MGVKINKNLMSINHTARKRTNADIQWIVVHYVGALGDAKANTDYYKSTNVGASADFWVGFSGDIWQGNDYRNYYSWHCGGGYQSTWTQNGGGKYFGQCTNSNSVGIEMCVKKKSTRTMNATDTDWYFEDKTIESTAKLVAYLMRDLDIDINHVIRHYDVNRKICPNPFVINNNKWLEFKQKVKGYYSNNSVQSIQTSYTELYRVRKAWTDEKSQLGAYEILDNAKANCPAGYSVFNNSGKVVWTNVDAVSSAAVSGAYGIPKSKEDYIAKVGSICQSLMAQTGILASVVAAQCCLETGFGLGADSTELVKRNNLLGMKSDLINGSWKGYTVWSGQSFIKRTPEYYNGKLTYINDSFRVYKDYEQCIKDYEMFLLHVQNNKGYKYASIAGMKDPAKVIHKIRIGTGTDAKPEGYCTDPVYETKILSLIKEYNLDRFNVTKVKDNKEATTVSYCYVKKTTSKIRTGAAATKKETDFSPLVKGTKLKIIKTVKNSVGNTWYQIKWNGKSGYIYSGNVSLTPVSGTSTMAKRAVDNARAIAADNIHGYNNTKGMRGGNPDYACSSFVADCYIRAGVNFGVTCDKVYTKDMRKLFLDHGFEDVTSKVNLKTCKGMVDGDVLVTPGVHTEIFVATKKMIGARGNPNSGKAENGKKGDQTGGEISEAAYQNQNWKYVLRYKEKSAAKSTTTSATTKAKQYRVQTGVFGLKDNAVNMRSKLLQKGFDCLIITSGNQYITQCGVFSNKANADALEKKLKAAGFPVAVVEV